MRNPSKKQKQSRCRDPATEEDRLSNLPDAILHLILSLLDDTKSAVQTSVLSKRWRRLWVWVQDLSFDSSSFRDSSSFENFLLTVLLQRDKSSKVGRFRLSVHDFFRLDGGVSKDEVALRDWVIRYAVCHHVRNLIVDHDFPDRPFPFPSALLKCQTLETLNLRSFDLSSLSSGYTTITRLHLERCFFECTRNGCFDVLAKFPNLTNLCLIDIEVSVKGYHEIDDYMGQYGVLKISGSKLVNLIIEQLSCRKVKLSAPNLVFFKYYLEDWIHDFSVIHLPSLRHVLVYFSEAFLSCLVEGDKENDCSKYLKILHGIRNAEFLELNTFLLEVANSAGLLKNQTCSFSKLRSMRLLVKDRNGRLKLPSKVKTYLLSGTPHRKSVQIDLTSSYYSW